MILRIIAVLLIAGGLFAQPNDSSNQANPDSNKNSKTAVAPPPQNSEAASEQKKADDGSSRLYAALKDPNWWLVAIAFFTGVTIAMQAREMRRATDVMQRSTEATEKTVRLQEIAQQQWIQLTGWRIEQRSPAQGNPSRFTVAMEIENPTPIPLTIESVDALVAGREFSFTVNNLIGPDGNIKVEFPIVLTEPEKTLCANYRLIFITDGSVAFVEGIGTNKRREQPFCLSCTCGRDGVADFSYVQDTRNKQAGEQKAN